MKRSASLLLVGVGLSLTACVDSPSEAPASVFENAEQCFVQYGQDYCKSQFGIADYNYKSTKLKFASEEQCKAAHDKCDKVEERTVIPQSSGEIAHVSHYYSPYPYYYAVYPPSSYQRPAFAVTRAPESTAFRSAATSGPASPGKMHSYLGVTPSVMRAASPVARPYSGVITATPVSAPAVSRGGFGSTAVSVGSSSSGG